MFGVGSAAFLSQLDIYNITALAAFHTHLRAGFHPLPRRLLIPFYEKHNWIRVCSLCRRSCRIGCWACHIWLIPHTPLPLLQILKV